MEKLRAAVDAWREGGYPGASEVTRRLFEYWFEDDHEVPGFQATFRYYFCQREAIETLVYVVEILGNRDAKQLIDRFGELFSGDLFGAVERYQTTMDGRRQFRRFLAERPTPAIHDLPPQDLRRYAFKMATGAGKTWVMAMAAVWSHFHRKWVAGSDLSTNFLIVAPNVIVYQRLEKEFGSNRIFHRLPLIPPEWKGSWSQKVILRGESSELDPSGNLVLTNIHQLYESRQPATTPSNAVEALLGRRPAKDLASYERSMLERLRELPDLVVMNDEAHHVHDEDLAWNQSLLSLHEALPSGLVLWLDFSATPKDQRGSYYPWTLCDYPLAQAVEDRIVKAPLIVTLEDDPRYPPHEPEHITRENVVEQYGFWLRAAVERWREHRAAYAKLPPRPVLFIMVEKNEYADVIGRHLLDTTEFGFRKPDVLVIHTDSKGEIRRTELEGLRQAARDIDEKGSRVKVIVSVMMLREGWDVRNVSIVLGLRPFSAKAEILPEQVVGRGLRLMLEVSPDRTQSLEVLGTKKLLDFVRVQLEAEGVGVAVSKTPPPEPVTIYPVQERQAYDIAVPLTKPILMRNVRKLGDLDPLSWDPVWNQPELDEPLRVMLRMQFATTETEVHQADVTDGALPLASDLLARLTRNVMRLANVSGHFAELYPVVQTYVAERCFGQPVDVEDPTIRSHLRNLYIQEGIAGYLARMVGQLTIEERSVEFEKAGFKLSETKPFQWRRNLTPLPLECRKTVFNYVATYNDYERRFAEFLDQAPDALRFASLGTTEQGNSATRFRVDYLKPSGAIGFYHPDWVAVQQTASGEVNWIIETKGRVWERASIEAKDAAMDHWCKQVSVVAGAPWRFKRVDQVVFEARKPVALADLTEGLGV